MPIFVEQKLKEIKIEAKKHCSQEWDSKLFKELLVKFVERRTKVMVSAFTKCIKANEWHDSQVANLKNVM